MTAKGTSKVADAAIEPEKKTNDDDSNFGCGIFKPKWIQFLNSAPFLLAALSLCAICQGSIVNGFVSTSISSIEKRFSLSSTQSGIFSAFYDIAIVLVLIPISFFGNKCHKGGIIATGMVVVGIGSIILVLPHFFAGHYSVGEKHASVCTSLASDEDCSQKGDGLNKLWYAMLLISQLFIGVGAAPLFTLGVSYMDENVAQTRTAVYLGVYMAVSTIGPALGFIAGGQLLRIWGDIGKTDYHLLGINGPSDPRWYGAWWIGFFVVGVFCIITAIPLFGFPRELPEKKKNRSLDVKQTHRDLDREYGKSLRDYARIVLSLVQNHSVMALILMQSTEAFLMNGFITFIPKVFENLFNFTASYASTITGMIVIPMGLCGSLCGAFLAKKMMRFRSMIALAILFNMLALSLCFIFLHRCKQLPLAGASFGYDGVPSRSSSLDNVCNQNCHCDAVYNPVCDPETGISYYSPCFAGCTEEYSSEEEWHNCGCTPAINSSNTAAFQRKVVKNSADVAANIRKLFKFELSARISELNALWHIFLFWIVSFETRDVSIGLTWLFMRILGSIPGAVIFGFAIDRTCTLWRVECGESQSCLRYDSNGLSKTILFFAVGLKATIVIFLSLSYYFYKPSSSEKDPNIASKKADSQNRFQPQAGGGAFNQYKRQLSSDFMLT